MKEQKNIERLFQEKFKDYEALPPQDSWDFIADRLHEKNKKKRLIPFWMIASGIAATFVVIGTLIWNTVVTENGKVDKNTTTIVYDDSNKNNENQININGKDKESVASDDTKSNKLIKNNSAANQNKLDTKVEIKAQNKIASGAKSNKFIQTNSDLNQNKLDTKVEIKAQNTIASGSASNEVIQNNSDPNQNKLDKNIESKSQNVIATGSASNKFIQNNSDANQNKLDTKVEIKAQNKIAYGAKSNKFIQTNSDLNQNKLDTKVEIETQNTIASGVKSNEVIQNNSVANQYKLDTNIESKSKNTIASGSTANKFIQKSSDVNQNKLDTNIESKSQNTIASGAKSNKFIQNNSVANQNKLDTNIESKSQNTIASGSASNKFIQNNSDANQNKLDTKVESKSQNVIASGAKSNKFIQDNSAANMNVDSKSKNGIALDVIKNKKSNDSSTEIIVNDSTLVAKIAKEKNPLEELLLAKEDGKNAGEKEEKRSKWAISTNASPVYFNSLAEGSSLDSQFNSNSKNYATTLSYGVAGTYAVNQKLSVRAGINAINLSYSTNDVIFEPSLAKTTDNIPAISRNANAAQMMFMSKNSKVDNLSIDVENVIIENNVGALKQNVSYIEVPLELSYRLLDKKFGIDLVGGMSTLFLNNNSILLQTSSMEMNVGRANNLNNIHFSSNVGLGFKYSFWKGFTANFQPMFKYQINTFSENSSNFKPYFIGLYSGVGFSF